MINDFFNLIFPKICGACERPLLKSENHVCTSCLFQLPRTNFHLQKDNKVEQLFWGRSQIEHASALYYFEKQGKVQQLIHNLKYQGKTKIGTYLGEIYGEELQACSKFSEAEAIVPVPLSRRKEQLRGYNQCDFFAEGLSQKFGIPVCRDNLYRNRTNTSQTTKSRYARWENVSGNFCLKDPAGLSEKRILLVDDVITTGSTLEACARPLIQNNCKVSILAIAYSK